MTVWIVNPFDNLPLEGFRPQRYWLMASAFADSGHDVTLFTSDFNHTTKKKRLEVEGGRLKVEGGRLKVEGGRFEVELIPTIPYRSNVSLARIRSHRAFVRSLREAFARRRGPDLIVVSLPLIGTAAVALAMKRKCGAKVVVDIMDDWPGTFYRLFPKWVRPLARLAFAPLRRAAERAYREADLVTGVADRYAELALAAGAKRYRRFYHGIALGDGGAGDSSGSSEARDSGSSGNSSSTGNSSSSRNSSSSGNSSCDGGLSAILYLGNLGRTYDLRTAIESVALDPRLTLDIAGRGEQEEALKAFAQARGVAGRVRFHGYLGEAALAALAAKCGVGLIPMSDESCVGVPYKLADYVRCGLFVVSSLRGESAALLAKHGCGAVYAAGDPHSLLAALAAPHPAAIPSNRSLLAELDASRIYRDYVTELSQL